jgi:ABC-type glycerol-3-phosphate transport system permease component
VEQSRGRSGGNVQVTGAPILLATMILRRRLVEGMTFGAVK